MTQPVTPDPTERLRFTSELPAEHREQLENLFFFNDNQARYRNVIIASIDRFGEPRLREVAGRLRLRTSELGELQALFALMVEGSRSQLVGVVAYTRTDSKTITLLHMAVDGDFSGTGPGAGHMVGLKLVQQVARVAKSVKGVEKVDLLYTDRAGKKISIRVRR